MKLSKKSWLLITVGAICIILIGLSLAYAKQISQENGLNEALAVARSNSQLVQLDNFSSQKVELERQLSEATTQYGMVKALLPEPVAGSIAAVNMVYDIARTNDVEISQLNSARTDSEKLVEINFSVISINMKVMGDLTKLVSFIGEMNSSLATDVLKSVKITIPTNTSVEKASADIELAVYTQQGS